MEPGPEFSPKKIYGLSIGLYLVLWLAEAGAKFLAIRELYSADVVQASLAAKIGLALRLFGADAFRYVLTLVAIYALFGWLNGRYVVLTTRELVRRRPGLSRNGPALVFLAVHGAFLAIVYALNAGFYPYSDLAILRGSLAAPAHAAGLRLGAMVLLGLFLLGFAVVNLRARRKALPVIALAVWAVILLASLDPAYRLRHLFGSGKSAVNTGPNVILIGLDSLNPQHTGYFGYPLPLTPHLDGFLKESVVFKDSYTPIARTFPAWYSILTGQYPKTSGVRFNLIKRGYIKSAGLALGSLLRAKGYETVHYTDEVRFSNIMPADGFDRLRHPPMGVEDFLFGSLHDFSLTNVFFNDPLGYRLFPFSDVNRAVAQIYDGRYFINDLVSAIASLRHKDRFFLVAHLCQAHWPFIHATPRHFDPKPGLDPGLALYDSAVSKVDDQFGRIIAALKSSGLYDRSIVVVLSDHGESAEGHGSDLKDLAQNHILLAWKPAGATAHREVDVLSRTIDIAPTILDLLGDDPRRYPYDGVSLKPWLAPTADPAPPAPDSVIMETEFSLDTPGGIGLAVQSLIAQGSKFYEFGRDGLVTVRDDFHDLLVHRRNRAILTPAWMLTYDILVRNGRESAKTSLFDRRLDPGCKSDVLAAHPDIGRALMERLRVHYGDELTPR